MLMRWPFVTRDTLNEEINRREAQIVELKAKYDHLLNQFVWRMGGVPLNMEPPAPTPSPIVEVKKPTEAVQDLPIPTDIEEALGKVGPKARRITQFIDRKRDEDYTFQQKEVAKLLAEDQEIGRAAANSRH
jgi:hypothetical protein